jgi:hypothetical protein
MSFVDKMQLEPGSTVLLHNKVRCLGAGAAGLCWCCWAVLVLLAARAVASLRIGFSAARAQGSFHSVAWLPSSMHGRPDALLYYLLTHLPSPWLPPSFPSLTHSFSGPLAHWCGCCWCRATRWWAYSQTRLTLP